MMLTGDGPLHLPPYDGRVPIEYSCRCDCGRRFLVFNPSMATAHSLGDAEGRAIDRAAQLRCRFVNSALEPFLTCPCGQALDFSTALAASAVM
jgi:hypothetical protein